MRRADIIAAGLIILYCIITMIEATKLPIGWVKKVGPGAGSIPFWLALAIVICALVVLVQAVLTKDPTNEPLFKSDPGKKLVFKVFLITLGCVLAYAIIGCYFGSIAFIAVYMRYLGKRSWTQTAIISVSFPFGVWFLFEYFLKITLPKGLPVFETLWYTFIPA